MQLWPAFFPDMSPHLPGCPSVVLRHELRRAAQRFFLNTQAWQMLLPAIPVAAGTDSITLPAPAADLEIVRIESATYDGVRIEVKSATAIEGENPDDWTAHTGTPNTLIQLTPGIVIPYPVPATTAASGLRLRVSVRPNESSLGIPDEMATRFREAIIAGANSSLMLYPGKPWTNPDMAAVNNQIFQSAIGEARAAAARSYGRARISSSPRWC